MLILINLIILSIEFIKSKNWNSNCMYLYVSNINFNHKIWYIQKYKNYNHIDYKISWIFHKVWECKGCDCDNIISSYQCYMNLLIYKLKL